MNYLMSRYWFVTLLSWKSSCFLIILSNFNFIFCGKHMFTSFGRGYLKTKQMLFYSFVYKIFTTLPNVQVSKCIVLILFLTVLCTMGSELEFRSNRCPRPKTPTNCQAPYPLPYNVLRNMIFHFFEAPWPLKRSKM